MTEQQEATKVPAWDVADRLRKALREADVSVQEMAEYLEVSRNTVGSWINGHHRPGPSDVKQWALRTGVPYEWLAHGIATAPQPVNSDRERRSSRLDKSDILAFRKSLGRRFVIDTATPASAERSLLTETS